MARATGQGARTRTRIAPEAAAPIDAGPPLDLAVLDDLAGYFVRMVQLRMFQLFHARFGKSGLSPGLYCVLAVIGANPGVRASALGDTLLIKRSNMTKLVDALERRGLVQRTPSHVDRRSVELSLTTAGYSLVDSLRPEILAHEDFALSALSIHERRVFVGLLGKLNEGIRALPMPED